MELRFDDVFGEMNIEINSQNTIDIKFCRFMKEVIGMPLTQCHKNGSNA